MDMPHVSTSLAMRLGIGGSMAKPISTLTGRDYIDRCSVIIDSATRAQRAMKEWLDAGAGPTPQTADSLCHLIDLAREQVGRTAAIIEELRKLP
jgi:hypothetical protein